MSDIKSLTKMLVAANRILAHEGVVDAFGHISVRHPDNPNRYLLSGSRSPELVEESDILEFEMDGTPVKDDGRAIYAERFIHGAAYEARPDVMSVIHNHSYDVLPFAISRTQRMRPVIHTARRIGENVPVWDIRDRFGDTDLLVTCMDHGRDLVRRLGDAKCVLMRGHGCAVTGVDIPDAVQTAIYLQVNAKVLLEGLRLGEVIYMTPGEVVAGSDANASSSLKGHNRAWEYLCRRAGVSMD